MALLLILRGRNSDFFVMCAFGFVGLSTFQPSRFELHREVSKRGNTLFSSSSLSLEDSWWKEIDEQQSAEEQSLSMPSD